MEKMDDGPDKPCDCYNRYTRYGKDDGTVPFYVQVAIPKIITVRYADHIVDQSGVSTANWRVAFPGKGIEGNYRKMTLLMLQTTCSTPLNAIPKWLFINIGELGSPNIASVNAAATTIVPTFNMQVLLDPPPSAVMVAGDVRVFKGNSETCPVINLKNFFGFQTLSFQIRTEIGNYDAISWDGVTAIEYVMVFRLE